MEDIKTSPINMRTLLENLGVDTNDDGNKKKRKPKEPKYNMDLSIQRRGGIWKKNETSLFIDSIIRLYPVYPALLNKHSDSKILDVVDFKQRFTGLAEFASNKLTLSKDLKPVIIDGIEYELAGKKFNTLDEAVRERFLDRDITLIIMVDATDDEIKDIFDRINMGHPLSNGHKRSTVQSDELRDIVYSLASHPFFDKVFTKANRNSNKDRDAVLQIFMLCNMNDYEFGSFRNEDINKFISYYNNMIDDEESKSKVDATIEILKKALDKLYEVFENDKKVAIKPTSLPMVCFGMYKVIKNNGSQSRYIEWLKNFIETYDTNEEYKNTMNAGGTAGKESVQARILYFNNAIKAM